MEDNIFISEENKGLIWQLLIDANAFINIPENYFDTIKTLYEKIITEISILNNLSIKDKNKLVMSKMFQQIKYFNTQHIQKPLEEVKIQVQEQFKNKQEEFIQLVNHNRPKDISFNDKIDKPFENQELNTRLNEMIADRSYDIIPKNNTTNDTPNDFTNDTTNDTTNESKSIPEKKVSFLPTSEDILNKLKIIETNRILETNEQTTRNEKNVTDKINEIYDILNTISINQQLTLKNEDKIIELLNLNFSITPTKDLN